MKKIESFPPIADARSRALVLGSMPGRTSLRLRQYYGHPQNRFWTILAGLFGRGFEGPCREKKTALKKHRIAVWDVLKRCRRSGSSDAAIRHGRPNDIPGLLGRHRGIRGILLNGRTAEKYFRKFFAGSIKTPHVYVPSTSPAHNALPLSKKIARWRVAIERFLR